MTSHTNQTHKLDSRGRHSCRLVLMTLWFCISTHLILSIVNEKDENSRDIIRLGRSPARSLGILFVEAGKKKKKEKSEVVVISVQNTPAKGGMYPIFVPSCGGGHGGYGRRKRSLGYI